MKKYLIFLTVLMFTTFIKGDDNMKKIDLRKREEIDISYKWDLSHIYLNWEEWSRDLEKIKNGANELASYKGKISKSDKNFIEYNEKSEELDILSYKVYRYPQFLRDLNINDEIASKKLQEVEKVFHDLSINTSWVSPELLTIPKETMIEWINHNEELEPSRFNIMELYRLENHVLNEEKERLLSYFGQYMGAPKNIYSEMTTADMKWKDVTFSNEKTMPLTYANYSKVLATYKNQEDRKKAFEAHYGVFEEYKNTYAAIYKSILDRNNAFTQGRNYKSNLSRALEGKNIPEEVYLNLINTAKSNSEPLRKYNRLRKKVLKLDKYHNYDSSIALLDYNKEYDYDEAKKWILESVKPLGEGYQDKMKRALGEGWIDVYETKGKRAGAYSAGVYGVHPYMLLNYNGTLDSVFTLSHELGHTLHSLLSIENQPFATHSYTIFIAEVASTFNERLLLDYLLEKTDDPKERVMLLQQAIRNITGTFFFQSLLADYEYQAHKLVEDGKAITSDTLSEITEKLFEEYYGDSVEKDDFTKYVWARIPHFYNSPYYVYQYATCFASSAYLYDKITNTNYSEEERKIATSKYLNLLKSGGNDHPMEQLKKAGVDLSKPEVIKSITSDLNKLVDLLEKEIKNIEN